jgi:hypothetical protein
MKNFLKSSLITTILLVSQVTYSQIYKSKKGGVKVSFFSETPMENISAENLAATALIIKDSIVFKIPNKSFIFPKSLMQEHFNETYMESDKNPYSTFRGQINEKIDLTKEGTYQVTSTGKINIHGIEKIVTLKGTLMVKGTEITLISNFGVRLDDHKIKRPKVVFQNIAEVIEVKLEAQFIPYVAEKK